MFCLELGYLVLGVVQQLSQNFFSMLTLHGRRRCNAITDPLYLHWISRSACSTVIRMVCFYHHIAFEQNWIRKYLIDCTYRSARNLKGQQLFKPFVRGSRFEDCLYDIKQLRSVLGPSLGGEISGIRRKVWPAQDVASFLPEAFAENRNYDPLGAGFKSLVRNIDHMTGPLGTGNDSAIEKVAPQVA